MKNILHNLALFSLVFVQFALIFRAEASDFTALNFMEQKAYDVCYVKVTSFGWAFIRENGKVCSDSLCCEVIASTKHQIRAGTKFNFENTYSSSRTKNGSLYHKDDLLILFIGQQDPDEQKSTEEVQTYPLLDRWIGALPYDEHIWSHLQASTPIEEARN